VWGELLLLAGLGTSWSLVSGRGSNVVAGVGRGGEIL
jgi:hypothetical protein